MPSRSAVVYRRAAALKRLMQLPTPKLPEKKGSTGTRVQTTPWQQFEFPVRPLQNACHLPQLPCILSAMVKRGLVGESQNVERNW